MSKYVLILGLVVKVGSGRSCCGVRSEFGEDSTEMILGYEWDKSPLVVRARATYRCLINIQSHERRSR